MKDGLSSAVLSHLWSQGAVFTEAFLNDAKVRRDLGKIVKETKPEWNFNFSSISDRSQYTVVFGIMRVPYVNGTADLPFFSKVSLRTSAEKIKTLGMNIAIEIIQKPKSNQTISKIKKKSKVKELVLV